MTTPTLAPVSEEMRDSLLRRIAAAERLWTLATRDLTTEHVNHVERSGVLPMAFTLLHAIAGQDGSRRALFGGPLIWESYAARVGYEGRLPARGTAMEVAEGIRVKDMDAWREYQSKVFAATQAAVRDASLARLGEPFAMPPEVFAGGFLELLTGSQDRTRVIDVAEAWIYQHAIRHAGELEHARALVGLRGVG